jgi:hypothetical protein
MANLSIKTGVISRSMLVGNPPFIPTSFESIATATGTGSSATITFSSIPATYKHLQLRVLARDAGATDNPANSTIIRLNNTTTNSYTWHYLTGNGSAVSSVGYGFGPTGGDGYIQALTTGGGTAANIMGVGIINIADYSNTSKLKTMTAVSGIEQNGDGRTTVTSILFNSTNAINRIDLVGTGGNFTTTSVFSLYGITG